MKKRGLSILCMAICAVLLSVGIVACGDKSSSSDGGKDVYTITFDANGGELTGPSTATTDADGRISMPSDPTHAELDFAGWYTEREGGEAVNAAYVFRGDHTVYAHWSGGNGGDVGAGFDTLALSNVGALTWNAIDGASKYVLRVTLAGLPTEVQAYTVLGTSVDLNDWAVSLGLGYDSFPDGKSTAELTAYEIADVEIDGTHGTQEVAIDGATVMFVIVKSSSQFTLKRLGFSDGHVALGGFYAEKVGDGNDAYYLFEQVLPDNKASRFRINNYFKVASGHSAVFYKSETARADGDDMQVWSASELATGYPQIEHGDNMYYVRVISGGEHYDYNLCVRGLYTVTLSRYLRTYTVNGGLRQNTDTPLSSAAEYVEGDIIPQAALYAGVDGAKLGRDSGYNVLERDGALTPVTVTVPQNAYPNAQNKVEIAHYFYDTQTVLDDCAAYAELKPSFASMTETEYGWALSASGNTPNKVSIPAVFVGKTVLSASFYNSAVKTVTLEEGATAFNVSFAYCDGITDIWLPSTLTSVRAHAFFNNGWAVPTTATVHCAFSKAYADAHFENNWNHISGAPSSSVYPTVYNDYAPIEASGMTLRLKDGELAVTGVTGAFSGVIPAAISIHGTEYPVTAIENIEYGGSLTIGRNVANIASGAFKRAVSGITVESGNTAFRAEQGVLFNTSGSRIVVATVGADDVYGNAYVTDVDYNAFKGCNGTILYLAQQKSQFDDFYADDISAVYGVKSLVPHGGFTFAVLFDNTATVTRYDASAGKIATIPETADGKRVTRLSASTFRGCAAVESIVVPQSVEHIDKNAFKDCVKLKNLTLPFIGETADAPAQLYEFVGSYHEKLESVTVTAATAIAPLAFTRRLYDPQPLFPSLKTVSLPDTIESVGEDAFFGCILDMYEIGGASYIGNSGNNKLVLVSVDSGVSSFEIDDNTRIIYGGLDGAFKNATGLDELFIPSGVIYAGKNILPEGGTFDVTVDSDCDTDVWHSEWSAGFDGGISVGTVAVSSDGEFKYAAANGEATIVRGLKPTSTALTVPQTLDGNTVTGVAFGAFSDYTELTEITLAVIGDGGDNGHLGYMFGAREALEQQSALPALTKITVLDCVQEIVENAFYGCGAIEELVVPFVGTSRTPGATSNLRHVGAIFGVKRGDMSAFDGGDVLSITGVGTYFVPCTLEKITVTDSGTIGNSALRGMGFTEIVIEKCGEIRGAAFYGNTALVTLVLPADATYQNSLAIVDKTCASLENVTLPLCGKSIVKILGGGNESDISGSAAKYVKRVKVVDSYQIEGGAFMNMSELQRVEIAGAVSIISYNDQTAFYNCAALSEIVLPASLRKIGRNAVQNCAALTSVVFGATSDWTVTPRNSTTATNIAEADLTDSATAANLLTSTYAAYNWQRA
ncbi:MAG: leucine-rich repeat protein [Roseburia sp.]|nr:leucine-rich repeat protein [Roseburia sp.]